MPTKKEAIDKHVANLIDAEIYEIYQKARSDYEHSVHEANLAAKEAIMAEPEMQQAIALITKYVPNMNKSYIIGNIKRNIEIPDYNQVDDNKLSKAQTALRRAKIAVWVGKDTTELFAMLDDFTKQMAEIFKT